MRREYHRAPSEDDDLPALMKIFSPLYALAMLLFGWPALLALLVAGVVFLWLRRLMRHRLGGTTGDTAGARRGYGEALELAVAARDRSWIAWCLKG